MSQPTAMWLVQARGDHDQILHPPSLGQGRCLCPGECSGVSAPGGPSRPRREPLLLGGWEPVPGIRARGGGRGGTQEAGAGTEPWGTGPPSHGPPAPTTSRQGLAGPHPSTPHTHQCPTPTPRAWTGKVPPPRDMRTTGQSVPWAGPSQELPVPDPHSLAKLPGASCHPHEGQSDRGTERLGTLQRPPCGGTVTGSLLEAPPVRPRPTSLWGQGPWG